MSDIFEDFALPSAEPERATAEHYQPVVVEPIPGADERAVWARKALDVQQGHHDHLIRICTDAWAQTDAHPMDPLSVDVLVAIYQGLDRWDSGMTQPRGEASDFIMSPIRLVMSGFGHANYCQALRVLGDREAEIPTLSPDESLTEWREARDKAVAATGWPSTTTCIGLKDLMGLIERLPDPPEEKKAENQEPRPYGPSFAKWACVAAMCALYRTAIYRQQDNENQVVIEDQHLLVTCRVRTASVDTQLDQGILTELLQPTWKGHLSVKHGQLITRILSTLGNIAVCDLPAERDLSVEHPRAATPAWVVGSGHRRVRVSRARGWPLPSTQRIDHAVAIDWEAGYSHPGEGRVPPRLARLASCPAAPTARQPLRKQLDFDTQTHELPWRIFRDNNHKWLVHPWGEILGVEPELTEVVSLTSCAIPSIWGALRDQAEESQGVLNGSGWNRYCPAMVFHPHNAQCRADTSNSGKSASANTIAASTNLQMAAEWYHYDRQPESTKNNSSEPYRRAAASTADRQGLIIQEEFQESGPDRSTFDIDLLTSALTGSPMEVSKLYSNEGRPIRLRYGFFAVAKYMPALAMDMANRLIPLAMLVPGDPQLEAQKVGRDLDAEWERSKSGEVAYRMALTARQLLPTLQGFAEALPASVEKAIENGREKDWRDEVFREPVVAYYHAAMVITEMRRRGHKVSGYKAVRAVYHWRAQMQQTWEAEQQRMQAMGATLTHSQSNNLDLSFLGGDLRFDLDHAKPTDDYGTDEPMEVYFMDTVRSYDVESSAYPGAIPQCTVEHKLPERLAAAFVGGGGRKSRVPNFVSFNQIISQLVRRKHRSQAEAERHLKDKVFGRTPAARHSQVLCERIRQDGRVISSSDSSSVWGLDLEGTFFQLQVRIQGRKGRSAPTTTFRIMPREGITLNVSGHRAADHAHNPQRS